jgi:hypothetical protein
VLVVLANVGIPNQMKCRLHVTVSKGLRWAGAAFFKKLSNKIQLYLFRALLLPTTTNNTNIASMVLVLLVNSRGQW